MKPFANDCGWEDLVRRTGLGDTWAFEQLYRLSRTWLLGIVRQIVPSPEDAEEVVMDSYLQIWRSAHRFDSARGNVRTWLCVIVRSRALDRLRLTRNSPNGDLTGELADPAACPEQRALRNGLRASVANLVASLSAPDAELIRLAYDLGHTQAEIAAMQQEPLGTVKSRFRSIHIRLRRELVLKGPRSLPAGVYANGAPFPLAG
jgi:RNA polymerase sigma-70 factor (ECF subfamily)